MKQGDRVIVNIFSSGSYEIIQNKNFGEEFLVKSEGGELGINWNVDRVGYINGGKQFVPFSMFSGTTVTFLNVETGEKYHWDSTTNKLEKGPCRFELKGGQA